MHSITLPSDQYVKLGSVNTRYWHAGSGGSVVLLHGIGCSVLEWQANVNEFARQHRVYALDILGFGLTDKPSDAPANMRGLAQFTLEFMDALGIAQAHLVGNSMGGRLALTTCRSTSLLRLMPVLIRSDNQIAH